MTFVQPSLAPGMSAPSLSFLEQPGPSLEVGSPVRIRWTTGDPSDTFRYLLEMPGDWLGGIRYLAGRWSDWGWTREIVFDDFILQGRYTFTVESRGRGGGRASVSWNLYFVAPSVFQRAIEIDWQKVRSAPRVSDRFRILAAEYEEQRRVWTRIYDLERRALRLTGDPDAFLLQGSKAVVGKGLGLLREWADRQVAAAVGRIFVPKTLYDIVKAVGVDAVLIYRNIRVNEAAFAAISAGWAAWGYEELARFAASNGQ